MDTLLEEPVPGSSPRVRSRRDLALRDIGGDRVTNTGYSVQVDVPSDAEFFTAFAEDADARLDIDRDATPSSSIFVAVDVPLVMYPISPGQRLNCYCTSGKYVSFRFFGHIYE